MKATWSAQEPPPLAGGFVALASFIEAERAKARAEGRGLLLLDAGDCWQGTPEGDLTEGRIVVEWMNLIGYDAMAIGNHEFDAGPANVPRLARLARFPWLSANLVETRAGAQRPEWARASMVKEVGGLEVAIVGVTTDETKMISTPRATEGFDFEPAVEAARREVATVRAREAPDVVIVLSHCGAPIDRKIAAAAPGVDAVIGGHTHQALDPPVIEPATGALIAATTSKGMTIGRVRLVHDAAQKRVVERSGEVIDIRPGEWPPHAATEKLIAAHAAAIDAGMDVAMGEAEEDLLREAGFASSELGSWICDLMRERTGAEVALTNKAGLRADIAKGKIRLRDAYQVLPFGNTCYLLRLTGHELCAALEHALAAPRQALEVSGIEVRYDLERPAGDRLIAAWIGGEPLSPEKSYLVVTNSFLARGGDGHRILAGGRERRDTGIVLLDLLVEDVKKRGAVKLSIPTRVAPAEPTVPAGAGRGR